MKKRQQGVTGNEVKPRWELDYDLLENEGLFGEYLEMGKSHRYGEKKHSDGSLSHPLRWKVFKPKLFVRYINLNQNFWLKFQGNALKMNKLIFVPRTMRRTLRFCYSSANCTFF